MWKITYNTSTGLCTSCNSRDPQDGESLIYLDPTKCGWVNVYPERYRVESGALIERIEWVEEEALKEDARRLEEEARKTFELESEAPVEALGFTWNGGQDSAGYIQGAVGLAQALGEPDVTITDIDNVARVLSFPEALQVAAMVGAQFRTAFFKKQAGLVAAKNKLK